MLIQGNFDQVPDKEIPLKGPAVYTFKIQSADLKDKKDKDGNIVGQQVQVILEAQSGPNGEDIGIEAGKKIFDFIDVKQLTRVKRLALSAGLTKEQMSNAGGVDLALLANRLAKGFVTNTTSTKEGVQTTYANVKDYLLPEDPIPAISPR